MLGRFDPSSGPSRRGGSVQESSILAPAFQAQLVT